jgi:hypothetical protein
VKFRETMEEDDCGAGAATGDVEADIAYVQYPFFQRVYRAVRVPLRAVLFQVF